MNSLVTMRFSTASLLALAILWGVMLARGLPLLSWEAFTASAAVIALCGSRILVYGNLGMSAYYESLRHPVTAWQKRIQAIYPLDLILVLVVVQHMTNHRA